MISFRADTRAKNAATISRWKKKLEDDVNEKFRAKVFEIFDDLLMHSPQFSGDFTSNWQLVAGSEDVGSYSEWPGKGAVTTIQQPKQMGDPAAVGYALANAKLVEFTYLDKVYFINPTGLIFTGDTVTDGQGHTVPLRPENIIDGGVLLASYLKAKWSATK